MTDGEPRADDRSVPPEQRYAEFAKKNAAWERKVEEALAPLDDDAQDDPRLRSERAPA